MNSQLKQPLVLTAIGATIAVAVIYAAVPLFSIPLFGFGYGWEYVATFFKIGKYLEMVPFLMPFIGLAGTAADVFRLLRLHDCELSAGRHPRRRNGENLNPLHLELVGVGVSGIVAGGFRGGGG